MNKYYISNISYYELVKILEIEWTLDTVWSFFDVPKEIYQNLYNADNKEEFYLENIREKFKGRQKWRNLEELLKIAAEILLVDNIPVGVNSANSSNETAMHLAAFWGDTKAIQLLALNGAVIDLPGDCDCTPLYDGVSSENIEAAKLLLKMGASPFSQNYIGFTPYELAVEKGNPELIGIFLDYVSKAT